jgi:general secretion pathway protein E
VLSTLHTNDTCSAITRLLELGVADYLIRATLVGVMAQRLVRLLCHACQGRPSNDPCQVCRGTGYLGRTGLFELLIPSESLRARIGTCNDLAELQRQALAEGLQDLRSCGEAKVARGLTRSEEVLRVCS